MFRRRRRAAEISALHEIDALTAEGKPVLIDFFQFNCNPCRIMEGIVDELAEEYAGSAHVVKLNVGRVAGAIERFAIRSTPTFILMGTSLKKPSKKARRRAGPGPAPAGKASPSPRWRASGLVKKDDLARVLESNGASRAPAT